LNRQSEKKPYWFSIETYVHIEVKENALLLYNPLNGAILEYNSQDHPDILRLVKRLLAPKNLQVVDLKPKELENPVIASFLADTRRLFMGEVIEASFSSGKPVQMMPVLALKKEAAKLKHDPERSASEEAMKYLNHLAIYINGQCGQDCASCGNGYKQFASCTKNRHKMDVHMLADLLRDISGSAIRKLDILGGDIFLHPQYNSIMKRLADFPVTKVFHVHYKNVAGLDKESRTSTLRCLKSDSSRVKLLATPPLDPGLLKEAIDAVAEAGLGYGVGFVIQSEAEFEAVERAIESLGIADAAYLPYFNGSNLDFFKENIFSLKEEILESRPQSREIFANQKINRINFGSLTIMSNRKVFANVNNQRLGTFGIDPLIQFAGKELEHGKSWRKIRAHVSPCKGCAFVSLCPPINNYTYAIGRNDLCFKAQNLE
jgi:pseudo-rSAM protein